jgi:hypothetical protein
MSDIYLQITETPTVVTLSAPVVSGALASTVTVANTVTVALDSNSLSALENVTVTVGAAITGTVTVSNFPASQAVTFSAVTISNFPTTQTIAGTVTANLAGSFNGAIETVGDVSNASQAVAVHLYDDGGTFMGNLNNPFYVSGTVTANVFGRGIVGTANFPIPIIGYDEDISTADLQITVPVQINNLNGTIGSANPLPISGTVTIGSALPAGTNRIGVVTIGGGTVTIGAGTAQIGSVTASISGTVPISISSVTVGNSVTIGSLPAISGTVTANPSNGSLTTRFGSVTTANTAFATSAVTNANRKYLLIQNVTTASNVITVGIGFTPTTTQGIQLSSGAGLTFEGSYIPTGAVNLLSSVTASCFTILEA